MDQHRVMTHLLDAHAHARALLRELESVGRATWVEPGAAALALEAKREAAKIVERLRGAVEKQARLLPGEAGAHAVDWVNWKEG